MQDVWQKGMEKTLGKKNGAFSSVLGAASYKSQQLYHLLWEKNWRIHRRVGKHWKLIKTSGQRQWHMPIFGYDMRRQKVENQTVSVN